MTTFEIATVLGLPTNYVRKTIERLEREGKIETFIPADANVCYNPITGRYQLEKEVDPEAIDIIEDVVWGEGVYA